MALVTGTRVGGSFSSATLLTSGPQQRRVLEIVRPMVEAGSALAVMGNHEFNAIAYFTADGEGGHLRARNEKNTRQHQVFLD